MRLFSIFKRKKDVQKFPSKKIQKVIDNAIKFLEESPLHPLPLEKFNGTGVYVLYYQGEFYDLLFNKDYVNYFDNTPIYVGKAVPTGWRNARSSDKLSSNLWRRIQEHANNIVQISNLNINDFYCKYIVLDESLISPVEAKLIRKYKPIWNCILEGFGNHHPGTTRLSQARSDFDVIHPGRIWAAYMADGSDYNMITSRIRNFLEDK